MDYNMRVQRKGMEALKTSFVGFKGEDTIVLKDGQFGIAKEYKISDFERLFDFVKDEHLEQYLEQLSNKLEHQYLEEVSGTKDNEVIKDDEEDNSNEAESKKEEKTTEKPKPIGTVLKEKLLENLLPSQAYYYKLKTIQCKDGSISYRYRNTTILQVKGKRKVVVYMTGKLLSEETFELFDKTPEEHKATHNAYLYLNDEEDLNTIMKAMDESIEQIDVKKDGDKVDEVIDNVNDDEQKIPETQIEEVQTEEPQEPEQNELAGDTVNGDIVME